MIISFCQPSNADELYQEFKEAMSEDIVFQLRKENSNITFNDDIFNASLILIEKEISSITNGKTMKEMGLPEPRYSDQFNLSPEYLREISYNVAELEQFIQQMEPMLNSEQLNVYNIVLHNLTETKNKMFFLDAPGGTGKTFLMNLLLAKVRQQQQIALAAASSGIAATLLKGGRTVHSTFKVPVTTMPNTCNIKKNSGLARLLQQCKLIIWDECSMTNKATLEAINRSLQDIRSNEHKMGGITVLLAGDFRQTLPVIPRGTRADIVNASLKCSALWREVQQLPPLHINMRLTSQSQSYTNTLLQIGNGTLSNSDENIEISIFATPVASEEVLIQQVWPNVENIAEKSTSWISERAILAPTNSVVEHLNDKMLQNVNSQEHWYYSLDSVIKENDATDYPIEFLNSLNPTGLPPYKLHLKIGVPVMLLRNLHPPQLCNGTRLIITKLLPNVIQATTLTGNNTGEVVLIPRIPLIPSDLPFEFKRLQFPLKVCLAMTINKSQGQTFKTVGIHLNESCFSHGQLYVAASRVSDSSQLYVYNMGDSKTKNVVYPEIFD